MARRCAAEAQRDVERSTPRGAPRTAPRAHDRPQEERRTRAHAGNQHAEPRVRSKGARGAVHQRRNRAQKGSGVDTKAREGTAGEGGAPAQARCGSQPPPPTTTTTTHTRAREPHP